ncbi:sporulation inhibitor of replication protein SirA [Bacillus sp. HMF5848]|uniref:sporulation inhibitor of replication protein SirA n=1 Tax=Bacillus sp. HMF5848 TaxID=2495421 RepID=UPI000F78089C|nr:sporulation inhibitor of replication protein SirA [Bacillus sp. HMF5848]RSK27121.1 sporulation inhibitor of replication protein SirA [Bacillus sp. HMF5848]
MRTYQIFLVKEEVAKQYFGRELLIFKLFKEYKQTKSVDMLTLLKKQINFITEPISVFNLEYIIHKQLRHDARYEKLPQAFVVADRQEESFAKLHLATSYITLEAYGTYEAETLFFEVLRQNCPYFLAIDFENSQYGWLAPIRNRKYV